MDDILKKIGIFCVVFVLILVLSNVLLRYLVPIKPVLITTESMEPTYNKFDLAFYTSSKIYNVGDVVVIRIRNPFSDNVEDVITRIVKINPDHTYTTKLDRNAGPLPFEEEIKLEQINGKVIFSTNWYVFYPLLYGIEIILAFFITRKIISHVLLS